MVCRDSFLSLSLSVAVARVDIIRYVVQGDTRTDDEGCFVDASPRRRGIVGFREARFYAKMFSKFL